MATYVRTQEISHDIGTDGRFSLRVTSPDVELRPTEGTVARVRVEFEIRAASDEEADAALDRIKFRVSTGDGLLEVAEPRRNESGIGSIIRLLGVGGKLGARVVAELPAQARVSCSGVSADLLAIGLIGPQEYKTVSGDLVLTEAAGSMRLSSVSGDLSLRAVGPISLRANTVSGDISAFAPRFEEARLITVSGDVELEGELATGGEHRIETVSGDLSFGAVGSLLLEVRGLSTDVEVTVPHRSEGSRDRRRYVIGNGGPNLRFSSMSGDVSVGGARRFESGPFEPPEPPERHERPVAPAPPASPPPPPLGADDQLEILRALERGEIDVNEANRRLAGGGTDG
jgi:hypothetical protein